MRAPRFAPFLGLALVASPAHALGENWVTVTTTDQGTVIYVDHDSFQRTGSLVVVRERRDHTNNAETPYADIRMVSAYDCSAHTVQIRSASATNKDGGPKTAFDNGLGAPVDPVEPDTVAASILDHVCAAAK